MRTNKYILLAATLLGLSSCGNKRGDYDASGTFEATEVIVSSEANGKIMQFNIEEGQLLKAGEEVGCIDTLQLYLKKMQLLASGKAIASKSTDINKQIAATKEQIGKAEYERKRTENLLKENAATQKQIDDIDSQIAVLKKQLEAQISTLQRGNASITEESSAYEIQVAQLDDQLRKCHITSPICGTVLAKYAEAGELATQGKPLFKVADVQHLFLRAYITADQLSQLKLGDKVKVFSDLGKDDRREYEGTITWISDKSEFTPKTIQTRDERANLVYATKIAESGSLRAGCGEELQRDTPAGRIYAGTFFLIPGFVRRRESHFLCHAFQYHYPGELRIGKGYLPTNRTFQTPACRKTIRRHETKAGSELRIDSQAFHTVLGRTYHRCGPCIQKGVLGHAAEIETRRSYHHCGNTLPERDEML